MSTPTEAKIIQEQIDPALKKARWDVHNPNQVGIEIPVDGFDPEAWNRLAAQLNQLKAQRREALRQAEMLFQSLFNEAFVG